LPHGNRGYAYGLERLELEEITLTQVSPLANKYLSESRLREKFNVQLLAIIRDEKIIAVPEASEKLIAGDLLIVIGWSDQLKKVATLAAGKD